MRPHYRWVAIAATALAASAASAQSAPPPAANPLARGEGAFDGGVRGGFQPGPLDTPNALGRPTPVQYAPVTPVPEPSEWLMMAVGLGVGILVLRRGALRY